MVSNIIGVIILIELLSNIFDYVNNNFDKTRIQFITSNSTSIKMNIDFKISFFCITECIWPQ